MILAQLSPPLPSTWKADDVHFEVTCDGDVGNLSFKLDDLLETNWLESLSLQLVYSTSNGEDVRVPVISTTGTTKKHHVAAKTRLCLSFDPGLSPTICGSCGATLAPTGEIFFIFLLLEFLCFIFCNVIIILLGPIPLRKVVKKADILRSGRL